jgi:hypothetical protein
MSAPWARDGEPDLACAFALVGREALGADRDGRAHIATSRVIVIWNHIEIGIGSEASITAGAIPAVLGQVGFVGAVVEHDFIYPQRAGMQVGSHAGAPETSPGNSPLVLNGAPSSALARSWGIPAAAICFAAMAALIAVGY